MKKFIRFVVVLLLIVAAALIILMFVEPTEVVVTRSIVIKAPKEAVFEQIVMFKNWPTWDPWERMDSGKMKRTLYGTDGTPGSGYTWEGDKTGAGDMRDSAVNGTDLLYKLTFTKPNTGSAWGHIKAEDTAGMTKVTWTCNMHFGMPLNAMLLFMNMDKMLGPDFENGLNNLKTNLESNTPAAASSEITEVDYAAHTFQGIRKVVDISNMDNFSKFFMEAYGTLGKSVGAKINGPAVAITYNWDTVKKQADVYAAMPVSDTTLRVQGTTFVQVPAAKAAVFVLKGGYATSKFMDAHAALGKYMATKGHTPGLIIEEYTIGQSGPHGEPDSNKWVTNIYYLIK